MACARIGGTNSATLDKKNADEDIRATVVQNVSTFFSQQLTFFPFFSF